MAKTPITCPEKTWGKIIAIKSRRLTAKNRVSDLIRQRNETKKELDSLGKKRTPERSAACVKFVDVLQAIEYERDRVQTLADMLEAAIEKGEQGELFDEAEFESQRDAEDDDEEPEPALARHAREEREKLKAEAAAPTNALGEPLVLGRVYRFTSRTDSNRWMEGRLERLHAGTTMISVEALEFDPGFGPKAVKGTHDLNTAAVSWTDVTGSADAKSGNGIAEVAAELGWKFPGAFVFRARRQGVAPTRHEFGDAEAMHAKLAEVCGLEATPEMVRLCGGGSVMVRQPDTAKAKDCWESVGAVSQVESDAEAKADPAASQVEPKPAKNKGAAPLKEVRDGNGRPRKAKPAK